MTTATYESTIPARAAWAHVVSKGQTLRLVDIGGNQAVDCLLI